VPSPVQIFISYARDDDVTPPGVPGATGFVTHLHQHLDYEFKKREPQRPRLWRDTEQLGDGEQFEPRLDEEINASAILLVVLSRNWMARPYCRRELESFAARWRHEGPESIKRRIVVVGCRHLDPNVRPSWLQGQVGFAFYSLDDPDSRGLEHEFYGPQGVQDARYWRKIAELAEHLLRAAGFLVRERPASAAPSNGRTIYLAKPATDMRKHYDRLVAELRLKGYAVVPDPEHDLLADADARKAIDRALADSEVSVHLVGEKHGPAPEDELPLVDLQLARAKAKALPLVDTEDRRVGFHRILWVPRAIDAGGDSPEPTVVRDPFDVLAKFGGEHSGDSVESDTISRFVDFLQQHLARMAQPRRRPARGALQSGGIDKSEGRLKIYVDHQEADTEYAYNFAKILHQRQRKLNLFMPAFDGPPAEQKRLRSKYLRECDSVVICWGAAPEVWAKGRMIELADWERLGRNDGFACRGLVAGPPPGMPKKRFREVLVTDEIEFIDLTEREQPLPEELDRLIPAL
jgi:TIR domain